MNPAEMDALIQDVLDGAATSTDRERLESWMEAHPEGRARYRELEALFGALSRVPLAEAPGDLRESVLRRIRAGGTPAEPGRNVFQAWSDLFGRRPGLALAVPFGGGLAAGALAIAAWTGAFGPALDGRSELTGTMAPPAGVPTSSGRLAAPEGEVTVQIWREAREIVVRMNARVSAPLTAELRYDPRSWRAAEVRQPRPRNGDWSLQAGKVGWRLYAQGELWISLSEEAPSDLPLQIALRSASGEREETISIPPSPAAPR